MRVFPTVSPPAASRAAPFLLAALSLASLSTMGCGEEGGERASSSAGVPERTARETLEIGRVAGPEEYSFGRVTGLARDETGRIYVADQQASTGHDRVPVQGLEAGWSFEHREDASLQEDPDAPILRLKGMAPTSSTRDVPERDRASSRVRAASPWTISGGSG